MRTKFIWKTKTRTIDMLNRKEFTDEHLESAYIRTSLMYTTLHSEYVNDVFKRVKIYKKLFFVLRDLETVAIIRNMKLNIPNIPLIYNDRNAYWESRKVVIFVS